MKQFIISILILSISIGQSIAAEQSDAQKVIAKSLSIYTNSIAKIDFILVTYAKKNVISQSNSGTFTLKSKKFVLEMENIKIWFDGRTQWVLQTDINELSITEPTEDELLAVNPMAILNGYLSKSVINFTKSSSKEITCIELKSKQASNNLTKVHVEIIKNSSQIKRMRMFEKAGSVIELTIKNYRKVNDLPDYYFAFDSAKYKNVVINDLR